MNTQPQRQARLTFLEIQQAIQQLQEQGFNNPSIRQIYAALGHRGSFSKIMELKQQVLANASPPISNGVTHLDNNRTQPLANNVSHKDNMLANTVDYLNQLLANMEPHLWESLQTRLDEWWSKHDSTSQQREWFQKPVQELAEDLQEMYQLWRNATQPVLEPNAPGPQEESHSLMEEAKETTTPLAWVEEPTVESSKLPDPQQAQAFVSWAQRQKEQHNGSWKPVVEWLNQHHIVMLKGQPWTPKGLSDFIRKKKQQLK